MSRGGFVAIHRSIFDHPKLQDDADFRGFVWLLSNAAWSPMRVHYKGRDYVLERGQLTISVRDFARAMKRTAPWAQRFFARMEKAEMIVRKTDTRTDTPNDTPSSVVTICNYGKYQDLGMRSDTPTDTPTDTQKNKREPIKPKKEEKYMGDLLDLKSAPATANGKAKAWTGGDNIPVAWVEWAMNEKGWHRRDAVAEGVKFIDNALAHRRTYAQWERAWRGWVRSPFQTTKPKNAGIGSA
jgi:hypothetical protein